MTETQYVQQLKLRDLAPLWWVASTIFMDRNSRTSWLCRVSREEGSTKEELWSKVKNRAFDLYTGKTWEECKRMMQPMSIEWGSQPPEQFKWAFTTGKNSPAD